MTQWVDVCSIDDLQPHAGVCALVADQQVAVFYQPDRAAVYAVSNYDPIGRANVLSRGLIGDIKGQLMVASPLYKQHFNLETGVCLEDEKVGITVYGACIKNGRVCIGLPADSANEI